MNLHEERNRLRARWHAEAESVLCANYEARCGEEVVTDLWLEVAGHTRRTLPPVPHIKAQTEEFVLACVRAVQGAAWSEVSAAGLMLWQLDSDTLSLRHRHIEGGRMLYGVTLLEHHNGKEARL